MAELAIQVYGGHGYISDHPVEQYARDIKVLSIWEGTNFVQSADLFRDKLAMGRHSKLLAIYQEEIGAFIEKAQAHRPVRTANPTPARFTGHPDRYPPTDGQLDPRAKMEYIFAVSTRFLEMMSEVTLSWLLLDSAIIAHQALDSFEDPADEAFYRGKIQSALFYLNNILPGVAAKAEVIKLTDDSAVTASADHFLARSEKYI